MRRRLLLLLAIACLSAAAAGFVSTARAGKEASAPEVLAPPRAAQHEGLTCPIPALYRPAFERAASDSGLPLALLVAVAQVESRFQPTAVSEAGARGLLQVMPTTALSLQLSVDEPESNVLAGARYLRRLFDHFHSSDLALAAYNAGPTAVAKLGRAPTSETVTYVANVTQLWRTLNGCT